MVVADRSQAAGKTKTQLQMLKELRSSGVRVRLTEGLNVSQAYERDNRAVRLGRKLRGLQHGKSAYVQTDREDRRSPVQLVVGSCNLTTSSKANYEAGVALEISQESETAKKWLRAFE
jgi:phosphatidylserine/phosphatidylglycerophosphate/cardiolipin synthase-like enzyme